MNAQITTCSYPLAEIDAYSAFLRLREKYGTDDLFLLESFSDGPSRDARTSFIGFGAVLTIRVRCKTVTIEGASLLLKSLREAMSGTSFLNDGEYCLPSTDKLWDFLRAVQCVIENYAGNGADLKRLGYFGYFGYDVVHAIERLPRTISDGEDISDVELRICRGVVELDVQCGTAELILHQAPSLWESTDASELIPLLELSNIPEYDENVAPPVAIRGTITQPQYETGVHQALHHISIGDIYQVQLGHEVVIQSDMDPLAVYRRLRARNPSPYMYIAPFRSFTLVGASPELYVRAEGLELSMRPIAGTAQRTADQLQNEASIARLKSDEKEIAEHTMLVDLCRNDLGRICIPRTLEVDELLVVERYSHVYHLVSNVVAKREDDFDIYDVIRATFPAGTMTGAPKIRAMEIIEATETTRRGPYAGAIGMVAFNGDANLALCIRTAVHAGQEYRLRASAGIVADSIPECEWNETLHKMAALYWAITDREIANEGISH